MSRVIVLGGGFGGLEAATVLRERLDRSDEVVLVARDHRFAMGWTKIWDLVGTRPLAEGVRELPSLAQRGVTFRHAEVLGIDPAARGVETSDGELEADGMVVALGAGRVPEQTAQLDGTWAHDLYSFEALAGARAALGRLRAGRIVVAVMGQPFLCPPAPFEAVLALDEHLRADGRRTDVELTITTPAPGALPVAGEAASRMIADRLADRGIDLRTERLAVRLDPAARSVELDSGESLEAELVLGVPGAAPSQPVVRSPLAGPGGWIHPDPLTLETGFGGVYAVGDVTTVPTATAALPKAGVFAAAEGAVAAANLAARLGSGDPETFDGHGNCYLELPGREVAVVEGDFFATPAPQVELRAPSREAFEQKLAYEQRSLTRWFGG